MFPIRFGQFWNLQSYQFGFAIMLQPHFFQLHLVVETTFGRCIVSRARGSWRQDAGLKWKKYIFFKIKFKYLYINTFAIFLGSKFIPMFCTPLAIFDKGLVIDFNCFNLPASMGSLRSLGDIDLLAKFFLEIYFWIFFGTKR